MAAQVSNLEIKAQIQKELLCINDVLIKIKRELSEIKDIVQAGGHLDEKVNGGNDALSKIAEEMGIVVEDLKKLDEDEPLPIMFPQISSDLITENIMAFHN